MSRQSFIQASFAPWVNDEVKGILGALKTDALTGEIVCKKGELVIKKLSNSDVTVSGSARNVGEDIVWNLNADLKTSVLNPWTEDLKGVMQEKSPQVKKIADKIESIQLSVSGSTNNIEGTVAVRQDVEGGLFLEVDYTMNWKGNGFDAGWESTFHLDSLNTEYGILENLHVQIIGEEGHVEVNWDNDILKARALGSRWELYARLNGFAEWNNENKGGKLAARLNFRKPVLIQLKDDNLSMQAPIHFDRFDLVVALHPEKNRNRTIERGLLDIQVESDLILGDATFSLDTEMWTEWLDLMIMRADARTCHLLQIHFSRVVVVKFCGPSPFLRYWERHSLCQKELNLHGSSTMKKQKHKEKQIGSNLMTSN